MSIFLFLINLKADGEKIARSTADYFAAFYEQYLPKVFKYVSYRIPDTSQAEDLTSAVFEKALTKFKSYSSEKAAFSTWIFTIARNTLIDYFRKKSTERVVPMDESFDSPDDDKSPEQTAIDEEECRKLRACVAKLSPGEQEIISLKFGADMTNRQIAGMLSLSDSNVGVTLYRAVRKLRSDFEGWQNG
jgi:RNA polymerase sigma factor (sigma-70 family)